MHCMDLGKTYITYITNIIPIVSHLLWNFVMVVQSYLLYTFRLANFIRYKNKLQAKVL